MSRKTEAAGRSTSRPCRRRPSPRATPRYAPTKQFFGTEAEGFLARAAAEALLEQARDAVIDAGVPDTRDYNLYPRDIHHKGLGRLRELAGDIVVSGSSATLRLRSAREDMTIAHTFDWESASPAGGWSSNIQRPSRSNIGT